ncbi:MAG TPA: hypothetical protein H9980_09185 [Candidatus Erysipelatoclostridium merdavium]|uniref:Helicase C-terminal domain-containing protein n=1 Tax=Candidatus Erysipelatoclostridium merdavium TaxID=2838566 RepID=A0A9D2BNV5_9FIRM|nr:hypothetical protein [Candidatus Erysipelatoclostridium merdavium]
MVDDDKISEKQMKVNLAFVNRNFIINLDKYIDDFIRDTTKVIPNDYKYIGEYLLSRIMNWKENDIVFINCGTGTGKTTFIKSVIENRNLKYNVLVLTNRIANKRQIEYALDYKVSYFPKKVEIDSYQSVANNISKDSAYLDQFGIIFCDESHFFLSDVEFNQMANSAYDKIMHTTKAIKVFLSATNEELTKIVIKSYFYYNNYQSLNQLIDKVWIYTLKYNRSNVNKIIKFFDFDDIIEKIKSSDKKWLIFVKSKDDGEVYIKKLKKETNKNIAFLNRDNIDEQEVEASKTLGDLIRFERFENDVLIATKIIDNGVNIIDRDLTNIVSFEYDFIELVQEIGRKRCVDDTDKFNLYLISEKKKSLSALESTKSNLRNSFLEVKQKLKENDYISEQRYKQHKRKNILYNVYAINPLILDDSKKGKLYKKAIYINQFRNKFCFNQLGYDNLTREIHMLQQLKLEDDSFNLKVKLISEKLPYKPEAINTRVQKYVCSIAEYLNIEIDKKDDKKIRRLLSSNLIKLFPAGEHDRISREFSLKKLKARFEQFNIPIEIKSIEGKYILVYPKDNER